MPGADL